MKVEVFNVVMGSGFFSDKSVEGTHQKVVLVTEDIGQDGVVRNAFYQYGEPGIVVFVKEVVNEKGETTYITNVWSGNNIETNDPQVRALIEQGYSNIRERDGKYFTVGEKRETLPEYYDTNIKID